MAAVDYYLKIQGIDGEAQDSKHKGEIQLQSWSFGATQTGTFSRSDVSGGGSGKVTVQDFHFTMFTNKASPKLLAACMSGKHIPEATLTCRKAGEQAAEFLTYTFSDLLISSFQTGGSEATDLPIDQITFNFSKISQEYKEQLKTGGVGGAVTAGWDLKQNQKT